MVSACRSWLPTLSAAFAVVGEAVAKHPKVTADPAPEVLFLQFADSALILSVRVYLESYEGRFKVQSDLHRAIDQACREAGITIASPQRDIHFDTNTPLNIRIGGEKDG